jgi:hypothetical protein
MMLDELRAVYRSAGYVGDSEQFPWDALCKEAR